MNVTALEALTTHDTPYGSIGVVHAGAELHASWIWKDGEDVDPVLTTCTRENLLFVIRGTLRLELPNAVVHDLHAGELFVIPPNTPFRGYRWPRESEEPCLYLAVTPADAELTRA